jgi:flavin-dependent dehydrogenase
MSDYEVLVIGGGATGLTAGMVLSRALCRVVVDAGNRRVAVPIVIQALMPRLHQVWLRLPTQRRPVRPEKRDSDMNAPPRRTP